MKATTVAEIRQLVKETINLGSPQSFTIGEIKSAVARAVGHSVGRAVVENALLDMKADGEAMMELRTVTRNGFTVVDARHFYAPRSKPEPVGDDDPFARFPEVRQGLRMNKATQDALVKASFREARERMK